MSLICEGGAAKYDDFQANALHRWLVVGSAATMLFGYVGYRTVISAAKSDYSEYQVDFDKKEAADRKANQAAEIERIEAERKAERAEFEARFAKLEGQKRIVRDEPNFRLVQAVTKVGNNASEDAVVPHTVIRQILDDAYGEKELAVVYHLFDESASGPTTALSQQTPKSSSGGWLRPAQSRR